MPLVDGTGPQGQGQGTGRGIGKGGGRGRMGGNRPGAGPVGHCVCPNCGAKASHQQGVPCYSVNCPKCGSKAEKLISPGSFKLVGGGWYRDGYSKNKEG